jgi:hypothetical protein
MLAGFAVAASAPVLAAGYWLAVGVSGPLGVARPQILPPFVAASSAGPDRNRTLVLRSDGGGLSYAVLRDTDPLLGQPELPEASPVTRALDGIVASLAAAGGDAADTGQALSQFDIRYVLLPAPIDQPLARQLDAAAGLEPLTHSAGYDLWQVAGTVARLRVVTPAGTVVPVASGPVGADTVIAPGTSGTLVLAEAAGGWSATLNGRPLAARPVDGWAQGFVLPAGGGHLVLTHSELARDVGLGCQAAALLAVFVLALPGTRSAEPDTRSAEADTRSAEAEPASAIAEPAPEPRRRRPAAVQAAAVEARRPRGQHAARHGKPSRRPRGTPAEGPPRSGPPDSPSAPDGALAPDGPPAPDSPSAPDGTGPPDYASPPDPAAVPAALSEPVSRPPWELGDDR